MGSRRPAWNHSRRHGSAALAAILLTTAIVPALSPRAAEGPRAFTNLQVLAPDISTVELFEEMKHVTRALGVECRTCHRTDVRDFASDEIEAKRVAREMMVMVRQMNADLSAAGAGEASRITCLTCHGGRRKPGGPVQPLTVPADVR